MTSNTHASATTHFQRSQSESTAHKTLFGSPAAAGRRITAGFSYIQRIGKSASVDVWFPDCLHQSISELLAEGKIPGPKNFPAEWAAVRQFELLQEAGNYKIYDLDPTQLLRTLRDITRNMKGGGYRVTVATIGSYAEGVAGDELAILDRNLQERISNFVNMLYLEEQSERINAAHDQCLRDEKWDFQTALPHVGCTLGARDLFRPHTAAPQSVSVKGESGLIPAAPHCVTVEHAANWAEDLGVRDPATDKPFTRVVGNPQAGQYCVAQGIYQFAARDAWREVSISYRYATGGEKLSDAGRTHRLARYFFDILGLLPQSHIVHDTAIGLQLPESNAENQWLYIARDGEKVGDFVRLMDNLFAPFNKMSLSELDGRADAAPEVKAMVGHMQGYGDRLNAGADQFYRTLAHYAR